MIDKKIEMYNLFIIINKSKLCTYIQMRTPPVKMAEIDLYFSSYTKTSCTTDFLSTFALFVYTTKIVKITKYHPHVYVLLR